LINGGDVVVERRDAGQRALKVQVQTQIEQDAERVLDMLASQPRDEFVPGPEIATATNLSPDRVNDAVALLVDGGYAEWLQTFGTAPFDFSDVYLTSRGRYEQQRIRAARDVANVAAGAIIGSPAAASTPGLAPPSPIGSPYGFNDDDWETVALQKSHADVLYVVLGYQFTSSFYDTAALRRNVEAMFADAVTRHNARPGTIDMQLRFKTLVAGYGEHLFNQIARDIIGADIAVFETSDLNPNVMLEMGVALTWGVRVLPVKLEGRPKPPSDVSGQTYADYRDSAREFLDADHADRLEEMISRALRKKTPR